MIGCRDMAGWVAALLLMVACGTSSAQTTVKYVHTDALGSVVAMTDASGVVMEASREYEPYGQQLVPSLQDGPGYTGHVQDAETGLVYMQQRYYDPAIGRFLSVDPVTAHSMPGGNFNRYWYANNNPYKFIDPDGRLGCTGSRIKTACASSGLKWQGSGAVVKAGVSALSRVIPLPHPGGAPSLPGVGEGQSRSTNEELAEAIAGQVDKIKKRFAGPAAEQYALISTVTRTITDVRGNLADLREGDVYKYGQTTNASQRYSQLELSRLGVRYEVQFRGNQREALLAEKIKLFDYYLSNGQLPPGNSIFK